MAMTTCKECEQAVSTEAATCPHCGVPCATPTTSPATRRPPVWLLAGGGALLVLGVVAVLLLGGGEPLAERDPAGARACDVLAAGLAASEDDLAVNLAAGRHAVEAETPAIRATAGDPVDLEELGLGFDDFVLANVDELHAACEDEGVDMPPLKEQAE